MSGLQEGGLVQGEPELLEQMIRASAAQRSNQIKIVGRGYLALLLGLCRNGFIKVSGHAADGASPIAEPPADFLWLPDMASDDQLAEALARFGRGLGPGGKVLVHDRRPMPRGGVRRLRALLARYGFCLERQAPAETTGGVLLCARKRAERRVQQIRNAA